MNENTDNIQLDNLNKNIVEEEEENDGNEETTFAADDNDLLNGLDWLSQRGKDPDEMYFGERKNEALNIIGFLDDVMEKPREYKNPRFIKYLLDKHNFQIKKMISLGENMFDYEIEYYGKPYINENGVMDRRPSRKFNTKDGEDINQFRDDMDYLYDEWKNEVLKKRIKEVGLIGGVVLAIAGLVSGLSLGLKRTGHSMVYDSKVKWKKLTPAEKKQIVIPWTDIEKASGKGVILIGDYLYVLIGGMILIYSIKK